MDEENKHANNSEHEELLKSAEKVEESKGIISEVVDEKAIIEESEQSQTQQQSISEEERAVSGANSPTESEGAKVLVEAPTAEVTTASKDSKVEKINIRLNPVGDAPILKQKLWAVPADREVGQITEFVKKYLKLEKHQSLFLFVNQAFAPCPDQQLKELYECFGSDGKITLHYSTTYAWG